MARKLPTRLPSVTSEELRGYKETGAILPPKKLGSKVGKLGRKLGKKSKKRRGRK